MSFTIKINKDDCIGCGACAATCEAMFEIGNDGKAKPTKIHVEDVGCAQDAADSCPVGCITVKEK